MSKIDKNLLLDVLQDLIRIQSINPDLSPGKDHNELKIAQFICEWLLKHGLMAKVEVVKPGRANVFAEYGGDGPAICLCGHTDTVGITDMTIPPFEPTLEGSKVYGRGSCDMKGGVAAIMCAAAAYAKSGGTRKVVLALVCDEEYGSIGAEDFVKRHKVDACILTEPSDLNVIVAHKGFLAGKVITHGKVAHGSRWDLGVSAISKMGPVLVALDEYDKKVLRDRTHDVVGPASMHVSLIKGGTGISTYASECEISIERRTLPGEKIEDVKREIEEVVRKTDSGASIEWDFHRNPFEVEREEWIIKDVVQAFEKVMKAKPKLTGLGFWTDGAIFKDAGIPTVNIGPKGFGLHEPIEWVDLESVVQTADVLYEVLIKE